MSRYLYQSCNGFTSSHALPNATAIGSFALVGPSMPSEICMEFPTIQGYMWHLSDFKHSHNAIGVNQSIRKSLRLTNHTPRDMIWEKTKKQKPDKQTNKQTPPQKIKRTNKQTKTTKANIPFNMRIHQSLCIFSLPVLIERRQRNINQQSSCNGHERLYSTCT